MTTQDLEKVKEAVKSTAKIAKNTFKLKKVLENIDLEDFKIDEELLKKEDE